MPTAPFFIAQGTVECNFLPQMANRHGLVAGATGTGKTITLRVLAENFSAMGVPVFLADVKGDLGGLAKPGATHPKVIARAEQLGLEILPNGFPVTFWDVFGKTGHPVRATISDMGPLLLARLLNLNETQEGVLNVAFHIADDEGLLLLDLKDLQAMLQHVAANAAEYTTKFGNVAVATVGTIQRALLSLEREGGDFFGEPALDLTHFLRTAEDGRGVINILDGSQLMTAPRTYAAFMLWLLSELFERLPELGDVDKPKLVFFFDEAHLLFGDLPAAMQEKVEQVVRLIRSKGVGIFFVSQNPLDIPDKVLGQLGNRFQHALRAFTPRDQKAVKAAAETFRANPKLDVEKAITELAVGEALVSLLDKSGIPSIVERAFIAPPVSDLAPVTDEERGILIEGSELFGIYETRIDRESAFEILSGQASSLAMPKPAAKAPGQPYNALDAARARAAARTETSAPENTFTKAFSEPPPEAMRNIKQEMAAAEADARIAKLRAEVAEREAKARAAQALADKRTADKPSLVGRVMESAAKGAVNQAARSLMRGLLGSFFGGRR